VDFAIDLLWYSHVKILTLTLTLIASLYRPSDKSQKRIRWPRKAVRPASINTDRQRTDAIRLAIVAASARRKGKGSPYSITEHRVPELILVFDSQNAGDVSHKPGGRLAVLSARPAVTPATRKRAATNFAAW